MTRPSPCSRLSRRGPAESWSRVEDAREPARPVPHGRTTPALKALATVEFK